MTTNSQKAKVSIELENGDKVEFVAILNIRKFSKLESDYYYTPESDLQWHGEKLPDPPRWNIRGSTIGVLTFTRAN